MDGASLGPKTNRDQGSPGANRDHVINDNLGRYCNDLLSGKGK